MYFNFILILLPPILLKRNRVVYNALSEIDLFTPSSLLSLCFALCPYLSHSLLSFLLLTCACQVVPLSDLFVIDIIYYMQCLSLTPIHFFLPHQLMIRSKKNSFSLT